MTTHVASFGRSQVALGQKGNARCSILTTLGIPPHFEVRRAHTHECASRQTFGAKMTTLLRWQATRNIPRSQSPLWSMSGQDSGRTLEDPTITGKNRAE